MIIPEEYGSTRRCRIGSKIDVAHEVYRNPDAPWHRGTNQTDRFVNLIIHISGNATYSTATHSFDGEFLDIFTASYDELYSIKWNRTSPYERIAIYFDLDTFDSVFSGDEYAKRAYLEFLDHRKHPNLLRLSDENKEKLSSFINEYDTVLGNEDMATTFKVFSITVRLFEFMFKVINSETFLKDEVKINDLTKKATRYINDNFKYISSINNIAAFLHVSPVYLTRRFSSDMGMSPKDYLMDKKLQHSRNLLKLGANVTEAAIESGFSNTSYFIQLYKKKYGVTPKKTL